MNSFKNPGAILRAPAVLAVTGMAAVSTNAAADTPPPPDARHHNPTWEGCKKQADDKSSNLETPTRIHERLYEMG